MDNLQPGRNYSISVKAVSNGIESIERTVFQATREYLPQYIGIYLLEYVYMNADQISSLSLCTVHIRVCTKNFRFAFSRKYIFVFREKKTYENLISNQ